MARKATRKDADGVELMFRALGYPHLRARALADHVLIETGPIGAPIARIRLRKISAEDWRVEMLLETRWETTPNVGPRGNMVAAVCDLFNQNNDGNA
jgi:hypothetical protein